jgi:glycine C-acetyltransferase
MYIMEKKHYSLKDFELSSGANAVERANDFQKYIDRMKQTGYKSYWIQSNTCVGTEMRIEPDKNVIAFVANDYLGMSQRPETIEAGIFAIRKYGTGTCAAQSIGGYLDIHRQLEKEIAGFTGQEDAILFSSGFGANAGLLNALLGKNDIAVIDPFIHKSALDGLKGTNIKRMVHNNLEHLEITLKNVKDKFNTKLVIIDGVYSQDGDLSRLTEIIEICKAYETLLMMDDAHGIGVMGANGRGTAEHFDCLGKIDIITGTFSKAFGCVGGFVAASRKLRQYLRFYANSNVFSAALTPRVTGSVLKSLELIKTRPEIRKKLWDNVNYLKKRLVQNGFDIGNSASPIIPIMVRDNEKIQEIARLLQNNGIFAIGIVYPAVRIKEARLRVSILSSHETEHLDKLVDTLIQINRTVNFI